MKTQNIMSNSLFTQSNGKVGSSFRVKRDDTFEMMINSNLSSKGEKIGDKLGAKNVKSNINRETHGKINSEDTKNSKTTNNHTDRVDEKGIDKPLNNKTDRKTVDKDMDEDEMTAIMANLYPWLQQVQSAVAESLGLTQEELEGILQAQGKTIFDLLEPNTLKDLVLSVNQENDIASLLTNENLARQMEELLNKVQEMINASDLPIDRLMLSAEEDQEFAQQLEELINKAMEQLDDKGLNGDADEFISGSSQADKEILIINERNSFGNETISEANYSRGGTSTNGSLDSDFVGNSEREANDMELSQGFQAFTDQLVSTVERLSVDFDGSLVQTSEIRDIANQIIESIKFTVRPGQTSMEMQLNPENLGKVNFSVQSKNGVMSAQFLVQNQLTKEAIESNITALRETLEQQGIKVEVIEVTVSEFSFTQNNQTNSEGHMQHQNSGNRDNLSVRNKITLEEAIAMDDLEDDSVNQTEQLADPIGNQVDYIA